jgi:hypothetical protein
MAAEHALVRMDLLLVRVVVIGQESLSGGYIDLAGRW